MIKKQISDEGQLSEVAGALIPLLRETPVACFYGEMGAGKTTFIKVICDQLGVEDSMSSPTFSIVNEYRTMEDFPIYHFDFYRIEKLQEAIDVGTEEYFYSQEICLLEWPEKIEPIIPEQHLKISIKLVGDTGREITITTHGG